jgi:hypothetical protein
MDTLKLISTNKPLRLLDICCRHLEVDKICYTQKAALGEIWKQDGRVGMCLINKFRIPEQHFTRDKREPCYCLFCDNNIPNVPLDFCANCNNLLDGKAEWMDDFCPSNILCPKCIRLAYKAGGICAFCWAVPKKGKCHGSYMIAKALPTYGK